MKFITASKFLLILILPILLFLLVLNFVGFDKNFYEEKFEEYKINKDVPDAISLHNKVINFITGKINELPNEFNEREKQHLLDVRNIVQILTILLYILIVLFILLLVISAFIFKINKLVNFVGKVLIFGGFLTILLALIIFLSVNLDFSTTFESFHKLFFKSGTYTFDPAKEILVRLYPEQLFMDLGIKISKNVFFASIILIIIGVFLIFKSKKKKNKKINK